MKLNLAIVMAIFAFFTGNYNQAHADEKTAGKLISHLTSTKRPKGETSWKKEPLLGEQDKFWYESVVWVQGRKITVAYFPNQGKTEGWISFWWREKSSPKELWTASMNLKGEAHFGIDPKRQKETYDHNPQPFVGKEHLPFWQEKLDGLTTDLLSVFEKK